MNNKFKIFKKGLVPYGAINSRSGFVILFAVTLASILLAITLGVANITLKELNFSTSARDTNEAFFAADAGIECAVYNDKGNSFVQGGSGTVTCLNQSINLPAPTGSPPTWSFVLSGLGQNLQNCAIVSVTKDNITSPPLIQTTITSKGYNLSTPSCGTPVSRLVERSLQLTYGASVISFIGASGKGEWELSGVDRVTIDKPANTIEGNVMIAAIGFRPQGTSITPPSEEWKLIRLQENSNPGNTNSLVTYYKVVTGIEPAEYTWNFDGVSSGIAGVISTFSGVNLTNPVYASSGQAVPANTDMTSSTPSPGLTVGILHTMVLSIHSVASSPTWNPLDGVAKALDAQPNPGPDKTVGESVVMNYVSQPLTGSTGVKRAVQNYIPADPVAGIPQNPTPDIGASQIIVLRPR